ncbi:SGNH/GDSL hydrolase family protein [Streptomyces sp. NPDC020141]|uniref:SGNH/GDSL hydrolase family protein n=1 Tax=Streptomyces sp. NPDC020141 TaxID=3365065 RepID=UPI0037B75AA4
MPHIKRGRAALWTAAALALTAGLLLPGPRPAAAAQPVEWVTLGDSYTAGVIEATGRVVADDGCARTVESYPEIIRRGLGPRVHAVNVSCGGATVENIVSKERIPVSRPVAPGQETPEYPPTPPQISAVTADTDLITVGVGSETLGLSGILAECTALGHESAGLGAPCRDAFAGSVESGLSKVRVEYAEMLRALHDKAPFARVITVGYPRLVPEDPALCRFNNPLEFGTITPEDLRWLRTALLEPLNAEIEHAAAEAGDTHVDLYASSAGHSVCDDLGGRNWADGLQSAVPRSWAYAHPNARGQAHAAGRVRAAILS